MLVTDADLINMISKRHKVSRYTNKPLPLNVINSLTKKISDINAITGCLNLKLVLNNTKGVSPYLKYFISRGVKNYIILAGRDSADVDEQLGYYGMDIMLYSQCLGLNTWWIGDTYNKNFIRKEMKDYKVNGIIALGYGIGDGTPHKSKTLSEVSTYDGYVPKWFENGVNACLLAPTALNKQAFFITGKEDVVTLSNNNGKYSQIEKGILKYSFELAAGKTNFKWS